jgi:hypothetical protein
VAESRDEDANEVKHEEVAPHVRQVRLRLERCLRHLGLTPFSTKFILQHISVRHILYSAIFLIEQIISCE